VFRHKHKTPKFIKPKFVEYDKKYSIIFFATQELSIPSELGPLDWTYVNTVEILNLRGSNVHSFTVYKRYQAYS
jgi:hypothetical protein